MSTTLVERAAGAGVDRQGDASDERRVDEAVRGFVKDFGRIAALNMETCLHCGMCADACHFFEATGEPRYAPVWKIEPFKRTYLREYGPFAFMHRLFHLTPKTTLAQLEEWQELLFDSCTLCGRCSLICPMGLDLEGLISQARHGMARAGLVPRELWDAAERSARDGGAAGSVSALKDLLSRLAQQNGVEIPLDKPKASVLCTLASDEIEKYPQSIVAMARIMAHVGADWTYRSDGYDATNLGLLTGNRERQKAMTMKLVDAAVACGAQTLVLPECGHAYSAMRWMGAEMAGKPLPFRVLHISEFLAGEVASGALRLKKLGKSATFHDPCQLARLGGVIDAPRVVLAALGLELHETFPTKGTNWCCGGGGGVRSIARADALRYRVFHLKMKQINETEAELCVTSCASCRRTFEDGAAHFHWDKTMHSLLELAADNLAEETT